MHRYTFIILPFCFVFLQPPLIQAIFSGDPDEIRALIYKSEDINALVNTRKHMHTLRVLYLEVCRDEGVLLCVNLNPHCDKHTFPEFLMCKNMHAPRLEFNYFHMTQCRHTNRWIRHVLQSSRYIVWNCELELG